MDPFDLTGQIAVVIGAGRGGLGEQAALALAQRGAVVCIADLPSRHDDLVKTVRRIPNHLGHIHSVDVTDEGSVATLADAVIADHKRVDIVVNAAGAMLRKPYDQTSVAEFEHIIKVNLTGTWLVGREFGRRMAGDGGGRIVNLTSVYAERVGPVPESAYYAAKAGIANVTRALAAELGRDRVTVNALAPGVFYPTAMTAPLGEMPDRLEWFTERTMVGRLGDPETEFAGPLLLLASPASAYMTGQVIYVDGGWSAW